LSGNEYHLTTFDPGAAATGWTWFVVDRHAFSRPENKLLSNIISWDCGEFRGDHLKMVDQCVNHVGEVRDHAGYLNMQVVSEGFELTQMIGGSNLLSPVMINSVVEWECYKYGVPYKTQSRSLRTNVTRQRLTAFGFEGKFRKDEFSAMQHAVVWLRRLKEKSKGQPWKLNSIDVVNGGGWDCSCAKYKRPCNMAHPR
jgi:hypothetical protein